MAHANWNLDEITKAIESAEAAVNEGRLAEARVFTHRCSHFLLLAAVNGAPASFTDPIAARLKALNLTEKRS